MKNLLVMAISLATIGPSLACIGGEGFLPKNDLYIPVFEGRQIQGINEADFNEVLDKVSDIYASEIARFGGKLNIKRKWNDGTVNAMAYREGGDWVIEMYGGLARHSSITRDAFTLVACHEIGHHIGGAPHYSNAANTWASTEGQSDYFATMKCMRKIFARDNNHQIISQLQIDPLVEKDCAAKHTDPNEQDICKRISMAGHASASMFAVSQNLPLPKFETPDPKVVNQTYESHPQFQCRLDTYFNGAVCDVEADVDFGANDPKVGACTADFGFRPLCWYKPAGGGEVPNPNPGPNPNPSPAPSGVAATPMVNGSTTLTSKEPNAMIPLDIDVSQFPGVVGLAVEISKPNVQFANPNGTDPDRVNGLFVQTYQQTKGVYRLIPAQQLPNWGTYQIRVIGLDNSLRPVSKNSNSFVLRMTPPAQ